MSTFIQSIGTAVPRQAITQQDVLRFMLKAHRLNGEDAKRLELLYRATGIRKRFSVLKDYGLEENFDFFPDNQTLEPFPDTAMRQDKYRSEAVKLSKKAALSCLDGIDPLTITHIVTVSCTGMYAPGLDIDLVRELRLPLHVQRTAINFMGCYAAFNALKVADAICQSSSEVNILIVATELCTLHFQKEANEDNLLANALFGDGSAALLVTNRASANKSFRLDHAHSTLDPSGHEEMAWNIGNNGFEMRLSTYVPDYLEKSIGALIGKVNDNSKTSEYDYFALHPGGKRILQVLENELKIQPEQNSHSRSILKEYGNMSSATILFVLKSIWDHTGIDDNNKKILAMAFGPGLTLESMVFTILNNE